MNDKLTFRSTPTPQRRFLLSQFDVACKRRTLRTAELMLVLIHLRESGAHEEYWEWGSAVAHVRRNQGWVWRAGVSIWATHMFYSRLNPSNIQISPIPIDIYNAIRSYIGGIPDWQLSRDFLDVFPSGTTKSEIFALLEHLYYIPKKQSKPRERVAFAHLYSKAGIEPSDRYFLEHLILYVREYSLSTPPSPMDDLVDILEHSLMSLRIKKRKYTNNDRIYLKLHLLVAFHNTLFDICPDAFKQLTGSEIGEVQPMLFVSSMENDLTLDIGFFELEKGKYLEPRNLESPNRLEKFYYPIVSSGLPAADYLLESDDNIRVCLYNHPLFVKFYRKWPRIYAEERKTARFAPTATRYR